MRQFTPGPQTVREITFEGKKIPFGPQILFQAEGMEELVVAAEICEDVWSPIPPSIQAALEGATVIVNCSASDETIGKDTYRRALISGTVCKTDLWIHLCKCRRRGVNYGSCFWRTQYYC